MFGIFKRIFGTSHERMMRRLHPIVVEINSMETQISSLSDDELQAQTPKFRQMLDNGAPLDDLLPEAFATVREASKRVLNMRHYDVQLIGGIVLHRGMIAEMKTGEGKTLVATSAMYLNALPGKGAHLVTVNDYLASRDADWMGQIYKFLGLSVGKILTDMNNEERRHSYACDITYGTNNEFGFDYLRDNMKYQLSDYVQRGHNFAIVDEVDSILIDEARTPLIISGQMEQDLNLYKEINKIVPFLKRDEDYTVDEKAQSVALNETGISKVEQYLHIDNIYDPKYFEHLHHINKALQAHTLYKLDQNYVIENGKVVIIDDFTGRMMHGRRWSDGLHQAIEAKEGVEIQPESQTLATITFQNYFRMYDKLAGMTGTADTEAEEFKKIYKLDVVSIPTARKIVRKDYQDVIYFNEKAKIDAIAQQITECHKNGQPILVGTVSVEKSEIFSAKLTKIGIAHNVLNAKNHKREAEIIAQAGRKGAVTIATNMAGRGTDILLGGNPEYLAKADCGGDENAPSYPEILKKYKEVCAKEKEKVQAAGGLFILGTERHESRRIDNQLRGRAGRQGDPGASRFFLSLDDDLLRIFGGEELKGRMALFGMDKQADIPIESRLISRAIENAQKRVEGRNFDMRKNLIEYDDVMNEQRKSIYTLRNSVLKGTSLENEVLDAFEAIIYDLADKYMPAEQAYEDWRMDEMMKTVGNILGHKLNIDNSHIGRGDRDGQIKLIWDKVDEHYHQELDRFNDLADAFEANMGDDSPYKGKTGKDLLLELTQNYYLREIDHFWRAHLTAMTGLRESISLRGYAQRDPKQEYKREAYSLFVQMMHNIKQRMMTQICTVQLEKPDFSRMKAAKSSAQQRANQRKLQESGPTSHEAQVSELQSMAQQSKPHKSMSMAELMPVSIAKAAAEQNQEREQPRKPMSMADLMPQSMRKAMEEAAAAQKRMIEERMKQQALAESEDLAQTHDTQAHDRLEDEGTPEQAFDAIDREQLDRGHTEQTADAQMPDANQSDNASATDDIIDENTDNSDSAASSAHNEENANFNDIQAESTDYHSEIEDSSSQSAADSHSNPSLASVNPEASDKSETFSEVSKTSETKPTGNKGNASNLLSDLDLSLDSLNLDSLGLDSPSSSNKTSNSALDSLFGDMHASDKKDASNADDDPFGIFGELESKLKL